MRSLLRRLAMSLPPIRELYEERNHLKMQLGRMVAGQRAQSAEAITSVGAPPVEASRLHLGCGNVKIAGWCNVDVVPTRAADVVDDISTLRRFREASADEIYACHVLEHFSHAEVVPILERWLAVLRPGGRVRISVPDLDAIIKIYVKHWDHFQTDGNAPWIGLLYGGQIDPFDFHRTGFNECWLRHLLRVAGFVDIQRYPDEPHFIPGVRDSSSLKEPFGQQLSLNMMASRPAEP
jgi:SAM-dependent methyltransferase